MGRTWGATLIKLISGGWLYKGVGYRGKLMLYYYNVPDLLNGLIGG